MKTSIMWFCMGCVFFGFGSITWAIVDAHTSVAEVCYRGCFERVGRITFSVDSDDYSDASPDTPIYGRIVFAEGVVNAITRVDWPAGLPSIFLAMRLEGNTLGASLSAPPEAISIVRWRQGEGEIWISITASSSTWIDRDGVLGPPSAETRVAFTLGITAEASCADFRGENLDCNGGLSGPPADTSLIVDLSLAGLAPDPHSDSNLDIEVLHYSEASGVVSAEDPDDIVGTLVPWSYFPRVSVARGLPNRRVLPWISDNGQFESWIVVNNLLDRSATAELVARRGDASVEVVRRTIPALGFLREPAGSLFPSLSGGSGYAVMLESCDRQFTSSWLTFSSASQNGPTFCSDSVDDNRAHDATWSKALHFSFLPYNRSYMSSVAVTNLGDQSAELTFLGFSREGERVFRQVVGELPLGESVARMIHDFDGVESDIHLVVRSDQPISGVAYVFHFAGSLATYGGQPVDPELIPIIDPE